MPTGASRSPISIIQFCAILAVMAVLVCSPPVLPRTITLQTDQQPAPSSSPLANPVDAQDALLNAKALLEKGAVNEAAHNVRQYLSQHPDSADAHFLLGYILFRDIQANARAQASSPSENQQNVSRSNPGSREAIAKASLAEFTQGAKYHDPSAFDLKIVSLDYVLLSDYVAADKWLTRALEWHPEDAEGWYDLGRIKYNENRFEEAVSAFQKCLNLRPRDVKAEDNLGLAYSGLGQVEKAMTAYANAMGWQDQAHSNDPGPFIDMASLLLDQNRSEESIPYLRKAVETAPSDSKPHELLGKAYSRLNQFAAAQAELEKAIELGPGNPNLPCMLGPVYRKQGLIDKAKAQFDRCAALNGTHSSAEKPRP